MVHQRRAGIGRKLTLAVLLAAVIILIASPAWAKAPAPVVKAMTLNMDAGTDLMYFFFEDPLSATQDTYKELLTARFRGRADALANLIAVQQPDLIALQEVTLWQILAATPRRQVLADQLDLIMQCLRNRHQSYSLVATQNLTDLTAPLKTGNYLRFLDRNVILARNDAGMTLSNVAAGEYAAKMPQVIPEFPPAPNGWMSVDVQAGGKSFRFFNTHLETAISPEDPTQVLQGIELIALMNASDIPVVAAGDYNSDASGLGIGPDLTPTAGLIIGAGYDDAWQALHDPAEGLTWPLFGEDIYGKLHVRPTERIDLIFVQQMEVLDVTLVGDKHPFPSDHAGVMATLAFK